MSTTVAKALMVLETIVRSQQAFGATEVARSCNMTKSNAHRLLKTLEAEGYLIQDEETKTFSPSLKIWELGNSAMAGLKLVEIARKTMRWLADKTGEAVHLALYDNGEAITIAQIDSRHAVRAFTQVGARSPAYTVATGKAMLAYLPDSEVESICRDMAPVTPHTITKPQVLRHELAAIRESFVAMNNEEWRLGVRGLSSPLLDSNGTVLAAIGICGPENRVKKSLDAMHGALVKRAAQALCEEYGLKPLIGSNKARKLAG